MSAFYSALLPHATVSALYVWCKQERINTPDTKEGWAPITYLIMLLPQTSVPQTVLHYQF